MVRVLVIIPYEDLIPDCEQMIDAVRDEGISFSTACLYGTDSDLLEKLRTFDIIVARGMTCHALRNVHPDIHVIEIMMTSSDILDALCVVKDKYGKDAKVGIILSSDESYSLVSMKTLTGMDISMAVANDEKELEDAVRKFQDEGITVFIGGLTLNAYASAHAIDYIQLRTSHDTMEKAISDAVLTAKSLDRERLRSDLLKKAIDSFPYCVLAVSQDRTIVLANGLSEEFYSGRELIGKSIDSFYPAALFDMAQAGKTTEIVQTVNGQEMYIQQQCIGDSGTVLITMQKLTSFFETGGKIVRSNLREKGLIARYHFSDIIADSLSMRQLIAKAMRYAQADGNVLVTGETGTGKELFVQSMHNASNRADGPFVAVNCAALSGELLESELFGYSDGAFTGARKGGKVGLFELAHHGTIFLDEIGEMPIQLQAKLLRVLQEKQIMRVGGDDVIPVDVRVMCATNQNIPELIEKGLFRRDLYYRINLLMIHIPPLRDRGNDIGLLFRHFVKLYAERLSILPPPVDNAAIAELQRYRWQGNIRELRNVAERIVVLNGHDRITAQSIRNIDIPESEFIIPVSADSGNDVAKVMKWKRGGDTTELYSDYISSGLSLSDFASRVGVSRTTLWRRFRSLNGNTVD